MNINIQKNVISYQEIILKINNYYNIWQNIKKKLTKITNDLEFAVFKHELYVNGEFIPKSFRISTKLNNKLIKNESFSNSYIIPTLTQSADLSIDNYRVYLRKKHEKLELFQGRVMGKGRIIDTYINHRKDHVSHAYGNNTNIRIFALRDINIDIMLFNIRRQQFDEKEYNLLQKDKYKLLLKFLKLAKQIKKPDYLFVRYHDIICNAIEEKRNNFNNDENNWNKHYIPKLNAIDYSPFNTNSRLINMANTPIFPFIHYINLPPYQIRCLYQTISNQLLDTSLLLFVNSQECIEIKI